MTREEAIKILKRQADGYYPKTTEALNMAIKALQEPVLDKIRKNIQFLKDKCLPNNIAEEYERKGLQEALDIIDNIDRATGK